MAEPIWTSFPPRPVSEGALRLHPVDVPGMDAGAPLPAMFVDERRLVFAYELARRSEPLEQNVAVFRCDSCLAIKWGPPNDEALDGHRYYEAGLDYYSLFEVSDSDWIPELEARNAVQSRHATGIFSKYRHFIVTFHDSTLEFLAEELEFHLTTGSPADAVLSTFHDESDLER